MLKAEAVEARDFSLRMEWHYMYWVSQEKLTRFVYCRKNYVVDTQNCNVNLLYQSKADSDVKIF